MRSVSRFESNLLRILQAILGRVQTSQVMPILVRKHSPPKCLSRDTVELVEQMLAAGCSDLFVRAGGWQRQRFIREQDVVQGRLWERREPKTLGLTFSKNALRFLIWLTATNISDEKERWDAPPQLTLGDELLLFLTYRCLQTTEISDRWCKITPFRDHALCALAFADDWGHQLVDAKPDFTPWVSEPGASIVESLQLVLADRWIEMERTKSHIVSADRMRRIGTFQQKILSRFLDAAAEVGRRDLARFVLQVAREVLRDNKSSESWIGSLNVDGLRVADRMAIYRAAVATLNQIETLQKWEREARNVAYYDEGYAASQLWKSDWEEYRGEALAERAALLVQAVEPLA